MGGANLLPTLFILLLIDPIRCWAIAGGWPKLNLHENRTYDTGKLICFAEYCNVVYLTILINKKHKVAFEVRNNAYVLICAL